MLKRWLADNSLSSALFLLFAVCLAAQSVAGWAAYADTLKAAGRPPLGWAAYLATGDFLDGVFSNWQAAVLQLAVLIAFSSVLRQRGAAHSRTPDSEGRDEALKLRRLSFNFRAQDNLGRWVRAHSLSLAFLAMFILCAAAHAVFGRMAYNEQQSFRGQEAVTLPAYVASAEFVRTLMQTWEAEFFAIGFYVVCSIFLRQEGSPESKAVDAADGSTGGADA